MKHATGGAVRKGPYYGWYVLSASFVILFFNSGARVAIGPMFKPIIAEFGWNRATLSMAFFLNMTVFALSLTLVGRLYDRYGPKWLIVAFTLFLSAGYMGIAVIDSLWQLLFFYGILAGIGLGGTSVPLIAALMSKWFVKGRGFAISAALTGNSIGQFVLVPVFTMLMLRYGWRFSYLLIGVVMLVVNIVLALAVIRGDPQDLGIEPYGHGRENDAAGRNTAARSGESGDMGLSQAMGTVSFWLFLVVMFICGGGDWLISIHLIPLVTDHGISAITAGNMLAAYGLMSLVGLLMAGPASDLIGNKIPIALTFALRFFLFLMILKYQTLVSFYILALAFGFTHLITAPLTPTLTGKLYGFSHVGILSGFISTVHHLSGGLWAFLGGLIFDRSGSYDLAFTISMFMALTALICSLFIREKRHTIGPNDKEK